jgi:hypothetical protein
MVLTHRPKYIEMTRVPKLTEGASSATEPKYPTPADAKGELTEVSKVPATESAEACQGENGRRTRTEEASRATKNLEPATRARVAEGI